MKTLNDYIKESILDDEDVLVNKVGEEAKNPFIVIGKLIASSNNLPKDTTTQQDIKKVIEKDILKYLPNIFKNSKHLFIQYFEDNIAIKSSSDNSNIEFFSIRGAYDDRNAVVYFLDPYYEDQLKTYGFNDENTYEKWVKNFMKRFNLTPTPRDMFIGII
jgi:hypothetical protein